MNVVVPLRFYTLWEKQWTYFFSNIGIFYSMEDDKHFTLSVDSALELYGAIVIYLN